jgi:hypothetical protein
MREEYGRQGELQRAWVGRRGQIKRKLLCGLVDHFRDFVFYYG